MKAPSIHMSGEHLEPKDYDKKMKEKDTVIIDVRNHYGEFILLNCSRNSISRLIVV